MTESDEGEKWFSFTLEIFKNDTFDLLEAL